MIDGEEGVRGGKGHHCTLLYQVSLWYLGAEMRWSSCGRLSRGLTALVDCRGHKISSQSPENSQPRSQGPEGPNNLVRYKCTFWQHIVWQGAPEKGHWPLDASLQCNAVRKRIFTRQASHNIFNFQVISTKFFWSNSLMHDKKNLKSFLIEVRVSIGQKSMMGPKCFPICVIRRPQ